MVDATEILLLPGGRQVAYLDGGDPEGYPVLGLHGTPGCRFSRPVDDGIYRRAGVRYVTTDRAGYGQSSRNPGRSVVTEAADVLAVADALGFERFAVVGGAGGGPHALACAALLGGRVERLACQSGIAPLGAGGLSRAEWVAGMSAESVAELEWAEAGEAALVRELTRQQQELEDRLDGDPASLLGDDIGESDRAFLARPEVVEAFRRVIPEQAAHGVFGAVDDHLAFARPWGFDVAEIAVPVLVTYGRADTLTPPTHGEWLAARIATATVVVDEHAGHMPTDPTAGITETISWLRSNPHG
jgi:pimeloyl-ACP methyl ester carboxylesterase